MQKIILDTNVIVSALISKSHPYQILYNYVFARKVILCISDEIIEEYIEVLNRDKFKKNLNFKNNAEVVLNKLIEISVSYTPTEKLLIISDLKDNKFLELAKESNAGFLITGNHKDFDFELFENTKVVSSGLYVEKYKPE